MGKGLRDGREGEGKGMRKELKCVTYITNCNEECKRCVLQTCTTKVPILKD